MPIIVFSSAVLRAAAGSANQHGCRQTRSRRRGSEHITRGVRTNQTR